MMFVIQMFYEWWSSNLTSTRESPGSFKNPPNTLGSVPNSITISESHIQAWGVHTALHVTLVGSQAALFQRLRVCSGTDLVHAGAVGQGLEQMEPTARPVWSQASSTSKLVKCFFPYSMTWRRMGSTEGSYLKLWWHFKMTMFFKLYRWSI